MASAKTKKHPYLWILGAIGSLALVAGPALSASAETFYDDGTCIVNQLTDGAPVGGSQCEGVDFAGHSLGQAALMGANVAGANFSGVKLQAASFVGTDVTTANFTDAQVDGTDFTNAGILPETLTATASGPEGAAIEFTPNVPSGLTAGPCTIVDEPIASGAIFPVGDSGMLCRFTSSNGTAIAVVKIQVTQAADAPSQAGPVFTDTPAAASARPETNWGLIGGIAGGAVVVLGLGVTAMILSRRKPS
jgi:hypothetical protein